MELQEIKTHLIALSNTFNLNLRAIRLLHCKLKNTDLKYRYAGTPPPLWIEQHKDFYSLKSTVMIAIQSLMASNELLLTEITKLLSLLPDKEAAIEGMFITPLKESHDRLAEKIKLDMPR